MRHLTLGEVVELHRRLLEQADGATGIRDIGLLQSARAQPRPVYTITADNGTEFHEYAQLERATGTRFYFAIPHHSWERGTNENTNGLLR